MILNFIAWYGFNAGYNVYNAYIKFFEFPLAIAAMQLGVGLLYCLPLWATGMRKMPNLTLDDFLLLLPIALLNAGGHCCAVIAMFQVGKFLEEYSYIYAFRKPCIYIHMLVVGYKGFKYEHILLISFEIL